MQMYFVFCSYDESQRDALFLKIYLIKYSTCFGQVHCPSSEYLNTVYTQMIFVMLVLLASASEVRILNSLVDSQEIRIHHI